MIKKISLLLLLFSSLLAKAQLQNLRGIVIANDEVEGIHVLNKSSVKYTVTDTDGSFVIKVKAKDTLVFSGLKYKIKEVLVTYKTISEGNLRVFLEEKVNELDEVVVGKVLTGNIGSDIGNVELKEEVNFYDLGIPGYTGKPKTIEERKLADADGGGPIYTGLGVNFHKLLNRISGRTKRLRAQVELSEKDKCMKRMREFYSESLFKNIEFTEAQKADYFYFCMDDLKFKNICEQNDPSEVIPFLKEKLSTYQQNLNSDKN
ncbi:carboxypeptidase-like regulatory domain-containing protein [Winogradskyella jejuensis]|uniref:CarboxypepD_reg-like domain-containing protein n=1 Tax=Winogradskyella jejuensis TaxID=1089305 RepID=A0A1M5L408_9FLAO|nr:carboxypeptidase-like regulatory domain-containing protein [Winogradskyella jejuensis]SHG59670.1 CarboxypepD_reg-like domain-containing protein [Winogradskyella jejuensis]